MRITCAREASAQEWDDLAMATGGGYHHCYADVIFQSINEDAEPLFVKAFDDKGQCVGIATGTIAKSHIWPFSRYCKIAMLPSLPATPDHSADAQLAIPTHRSCSFSALKKSGFE